MYRIITSHHIPGGSIPCHLTWYIIAHQTTYLVFIYSSHRIVLPYLTISDYFEVSHPITSDDITPHHTTSHDIIIAHEQKKHDNVYRIAISHDTTSYHVNQSHPTMYHIIPQISSCNCSTAVVRRSHKFQIETVPPLLWDGRSPSGPEGLRGM